MDCKPEKINASSFAVNVSPPDYKREPLQVMPFAALSVSKIDIDTIRYHKKLTNYDTQNSDYEDQ